MFKKELFVSSLRGTKRNLMYRSKDLEVTGKFDVRPKRDIGLDEDFFTYFREQNYDMEIVSIMMANAVDTIATFNLKDFKDILEVKILSESKPQP